MLPKGLLDQAHLFVREHFAERMPAWMTFHDLQHTLAVARYAVEIGRGCRLSGADVQLLELAALFHDTGYAVTYAGHETASAKIARAFLAKHRGSSTLRKKVETLIMATRPAASPRSLTQRVLRDADSAKAGQLDFEEKSERLRKEFEHVRKHKIKHSAWLKENLAYLEAHRFYTPWARARFGKQRLLNLARLQQRAVLPKNEQAPTASPDEPLFDRDLSWLAFNARVLQEAEDPRVPLLERIKFLAIHSSNLDEFYRVRVAQLLSLSKLRRTTRSALDVPPEERIAAINKEALRQQRVFGKLYRERLVPALAARRIRFRTETQLDRAQRTFVEQFFHARIAPLLQTVALRTGNAPFIEDRKLYLVFSVGQRAGGKKKRFLVNVPSSELGRFLTLPSSHGRTDLMFLDDAIRFCAPEVFKGHKVFSCHAIKLSRDAELYLDEEFAENVVEKVRKSLRKRLTGMPSRFLYDSEMPRPVLKDLRAALGVKRSDLIPGGRYHNFADMMSLPVPGHADLREKPLAACIHPAIAKHGSAIKAARKGDVLLHFPYHDFRQVVTMVTQAARDPHVTHIAITLYRVARGSLICEALLQAARAGKKVTAFVEVQARFDEGNNLFWGEALEQAGAQVLYSREGLKVHCKLCLIERRENGKLARYAYLGTGNFNERTSAIYGDLALITADTAMVSDVVNVFAHLKDPNTRLHLRKLVMAPGFMRSAMNALIDREITAALSGKPASILLKLNSLEDAPLIQKLYDASKAGVQVRLIVRGICCLMPGVQGCSERIEAISIVDRFLEHARAYVFHNQGQPMVLLSSADWMERNMDRRVEAAFPITDPVLREEVLSFLELQWADHAKARIIDGEQQNKYRPGRNGRNALRSQTAHYQLIVRASARAKTRH